MAPEILVTALVVTYNHAGYIRRAIDSVLSQEANFEIEVLISEDHSTDGTREIVQEFADRFPLRIRLLLSPYNLHSNEPVARGLRAAKGALVSILDGDDYWTDNQKLARQAAYLQANPGCAAHFFNARIAEGEVLTDRLWVRPDQSRRMSLADIWQGNPFAINGSMLRADAIRELPKWYDSLGLTDWPLYVLCAGHGSLDFDPSPSAVYRLHQGGTFSSLDIEAKLRATDQFYKQMNACLGGRHESYARAGHSHLFHDWAYAYLAEGKVGLARDAWWRSRWGLGWRDAVPLHRWAGLGTRIAAAMAQS